MKNELHKLLESYPTTVNHTDIVDFANFDERLSAVDSLVVNTIGVGNLNEMIAKVEANGGTIAVPKKPVPGIGWLAYFKDVEGNLFGILQPDTNAK